jgi:hypothetical protein
MKVKDALYYMQNPNDLQPPKVLDMNIVFDTKDRSDLVILSTYVVKGVVHVDIGDKYE